MSLYQYALETMLKTSLQNRQALITAVANLPGLSRTTAVRMVDRYLFEKFGK